MHGFNFQVETVYGATVAFPALLLQMVFVGVKPG